MIYFAYGSNMSSKRLHKRCSSAIVEQTAKLSKYRLFFHKKSIDGTGKADVIWTGDNNDAVYGVIFHIAKKDIRALDAAEGEGKHYERVTRKVQGVDGRRRTVQMYIAKIISFDEMLHPSKQYLSYLIQGAKEHCLPKAYIQCLKHTRTMKCNMSKIGDDLNKILHILKHRNDK